VSAFYHEGSRELQERFDTRRLADRLEDVKVRDHLTAEDAAFIQARDMLFLATVDEDGRPTCSYKGGDPGFVRVVDERTLAIPNYDGNGMYRSWGNVRRNPSVGLLFIDWQRQRRLRVDGDASIALDDPLIESWPGAQFVVRVTVRDVFPNCPRYIHRMELLERSRFVPRAEVDPPVPEWKRTEWARDVLPAGDPADARPES
jgi:predicted pyridoxine 5'-phosphate oxidase superfamily flavin-nucleotide-binding protein